MPRSPRSPSRPTALRAGAIRRALLGAVAVGVVVLASWVALVSAGPAGYASGRDMYVGEAIRRVHERLAPYTTWEFGGCEVGVRMDCSCYVQYVVKSVYGVDIGRSTWDQVPRLESWLSDGSVSVQRIFDGGKGGRAIDLSTLDLRPGDLVYLARQVKPIRHVMVYAGGGLWSNSASTHYRIEYFDHHRLTAPRWFVLGVYRLGVRPPGAGTVFEPDWRPSPEDVVTVNTANAHMDAAIRAFDRFADALRTGDAAAREAVFAPDGTFTPADDDPVQWEMSRTELLRWLDNRVPPDWTVSNVARIGTPTVTARSARLADFTLQVEVTLHPSRQPGEPVVHFFRWQGTMRFPAAGAGEARILHISPLG